VRTDRPVDGRWDRLGDVVDLAALRGKNVVVAGLGSGGSTVALELAKAGVGRFTLIDPDRIEESNLIRHECDDRYLGWNKAEAVADLILHRNPKAELQAMPFDLLRMDGVASLEVARADLVAVCTDAEAPKHFLNRFCTAMGVPAVYAGVYERATGGEVIRCPGGAEDACYACVTSVLKESVPVDEGSQLDYGAIGPDGVLHGAPGLGLDVRLVALIQAKVCLATLLPSGPGSRWADLPGNVVLFGTAPVEGLFPPPLASAFLHVAAQEGCLMCGPMRPRRVASPGA
jgi:molybdopterin/thiamine biosynthesis adenylyltransferase